MASRKKIILGNLEIGGGAPISIQSMTMSPTWNVEATLREIKELEEVGCEIIRVSVPDKKSVQVLPSLLKQIQIPLIADIHFNAEMALLSLDAGVDGIRINPGNIGSFEKVQAIIRKAKQRNVAIRIGVNSGSLEKDLLEKFGYPSPEALVESAVRWVSFFEKERFYNLKVSLKSSSAKNTILGYRLLSKAIDYPLHLGVTEAGPVFQGSIKTAVAFGALLIDGIGDTIRVSLSADCREEIKAAKEILKALELRSFGVDVIACPSCARAEINVVALANRVEKALAHIKTPLKVAVMGCAVNGPGEAHEAHIGIAGGRQEGLLYVDGKIHKKILEKDLFQALIDQVNLIEQNRLEN